MKSNFQFGASKADITPDESYYSKLFGLGGIPLAGVIDRLFLRVMAFSDGCEKALVIAFDLDKAPNPKTWIPMISEAAGVPEENIIYIGTHTHSAPITTQRPREPVGDHVTQEMKDATKRYEQELLDKLIPAVKEAVEHMVPARMGSGTGKSYINVNRNADYVMEGEDGTLYPFVTHAANYNAYVNRDVFVMKIESEQGQPLAFFINYAMHNAVMYLNPYNEQRHMGISADVAGTVSRYVEEKYPGSVAIWSSGAAGDVNPVLSGAFFFPSPKNGDMQVAVSSTWQEMRQRMEYLAATHYADVLSTIRSIDNMSEYMQINGAVEWSETPSKTEGQPYRIRLHALRLGDIVLYGVGGEMYTSFGKLVQEISPMKNTVVINHDASLIEDPGYIVDDDTMRRAAQKAPSHGFVPGGHSPALPGYVEKSLIEHTRSLVHKVM